jgi:hypothetical protein
MDAALSIVTIGSIIGVDEAMQAFQGRFKQKVTIRRKTTSTGLKISALDVAGSVLQWISLSGVRSRKCSNPITP